MPYVTGAATWSTCSVMVKKKGCFFYIIPLLPSFWSFINFFSESSYFHFRTESTSNSELQQASPCLWPKEVSLRPVVQQWCNHAEERSCLFDLSASTSLRAEHYAIHVRTTHQPYAIVLHCVIFCPLHLQHNFNIELTWLFSLLFIPNSTFSKKNWTIITHYVHSDINLTTFALLPWTFCRTATEM